MADPEEIYQEVLKEEQSKGSSAPVAEGRAKSARARAEAGSPHPKEARWWAGAQPHLEGGGDGAEPAEEEPAEEEPAEEEQPAAEQPAAEQPAEPAGQPQEQPATQPAEQPAAEQPAAAQPAATAVATAPAPVPTTGVAPGTASGNRLRPEDAVASEAQFEGQRAMYERRKLIDELVATGVPAVTASDAGRQRAPWLAILYLLIPLLVIAYLVTNQESSPGETGGGPSVEEPGGGDGGAGGDALVAEGIAFASDTIELAAGEPNPYSLENRDQVVHNLAIFTNEQEATGGGDALFTSPDVDGGATEEFEIDPLDRGEYYFHCDYHVTMSGAVEVR